ncbi:hypothetical protein PDIG_69070 [Penicillium digitatum PHI26]|uniref:Uncharacterized protein n=2 Tax=Penicillium digitatum TaxID=36651 RepID=K9FJD1_PEND2|nr:hypothetical protein PDIP_78360 [Penicillium digitatum Pd1]EKV06575.1 hypothetical protein PDIP_78360 [Penicillium digitatum Pd1]EKV08332.1 hypothetical protein PDIG_69070 [Penicillium digitatum PHI26]
MQGNILVAVLLTIALVVPFFGWLFYIWYRSHMARMHQEGQIFNRRNRDRAQANFEPANGAENPTIGPYFTPRGWVRPKTRGLSHDMRPPQYVHPRKPIYTGNPSSDQHFQGPNQASAHNPPHAVNQQPKPLSKRQKRKQRALQNKQKQQLEREQQRSQNEQRGNQNRNQRKKKNTNPDHSSQKSPTIQGGQDEQHDPWGISEGQNDQTSNHGGSGWGNDKTSRENQHNTGQNNNSDWGNNFNNAQEEQRNTGPGSSRRGSRMNHNSPREKSAQWDNSHPASPDIASRNNADFLGGNWGQSDDGEQRDSLSRSNYSNEDHNRRYGWVDDDAKSYHNKIKRNRHASPERRSRKEADNRSRWGQDDSGTRHNSSSWSNHPNEDRNRHYGRKNSDKNSYHKHRKDNRHASPDQNSRSPSSPNRDWGQNGHGEWGNSYNRSRSNSWVHAEQHHDDGSPTWSQDGRLHRDKKKKERWQIELEENEKIRHSRSRSRERSDAGWDKRSQGSDWKETQKW